MSEKDAAIQVANEMECHIKLDKAAGEATYRCSIDSDSQAAAVYGVAVMMRQLAKATGRSLEQTLSLVATVLLAQDGG